MEPHKGRHTWFVSSPDQIRERDVKRAENLLNLVGKINATEAKYKEIIKNPSPEKYVDPEFHPTAAITEEKPEILANVSWQRIEDHYPIISYNNISSEPICQGELGDCYFISAVCFIAEKRPDLVRKIVRHVDYKHGCACIYFHSFGNLIPVIVDTLIPFKYGRPKFVEPRTNNDFAWFCLLEKAFAKMSGSYSDIVSGQSDIALFSLIGWYPMSVDITKYAKNQEDMNYVWYFLKKWNSEGCMIGCSVTLYVNAVLKQKDYEDKNLTPYHEYAILDVKEVQNKRFLKLRNPWGRFEWNGDWSDKSPLWTPFLKNILGYVDSDDGSFWMILEDFMKYYTDISISQPPLDEWTLHSIRTKLEPGENDGRNTELPQWKIHFDKPGIIRVQLEKIGPNVKHCLILNKTNGKRIRSCDPNVIIFDGPYLVKDTLKYIDGIELEVTDIDGDWAFTVVRDKADTQSYVRVIIYTEMPSTLEYMENPNLTKQFRVHNTTKPGTLTTSGIYQSIASHSQRFR